MEGRAKCEAVTQMALPRGINWCLAFGEGQEIWFVLAFKYSE